MTDKSPRLRLMVPHEDGADRLAGWYLLSVYLQRTLGLALRVEHAPPGDPVPSLAQDRGLIVYGQAHTVARGVAEAGWIPVMRPMKKFEEVLILARRGVTSGARRPVAVACGEDHWLLPELGLDLLAEQGLGEDDWVLHSHATAGQALAALLDGACELALLAVSDWDQLKPAARHAFYLVAQSHSRAAFPALCVSADLKAMRPALIDAFDGLRQHASGQHICADLGEEGFEAVPMHGLEAMLARLRMRIPA
ncbi:MAG: hypothetical protein ABI574_00120 [Burkholderiales bacterium]